MPVLVDYLLGGTTLTRPWFAQCSYGGIGWLVSVSVGAELTQEVFFHEVLVHHFTDVDLRLELLNLVVGIGDVNVQHRVPVPFDRIEVALDCHLVVFEIEQILNAAGQIDRQPLSPLDCLCLLFWMLWTRIILIGLFSATEFDLVIKVPVDIKLRQHEEHRIVCFIFSQSIDDWLWKHGLWR